MTASLENTEIEEKDEVVAETQQSNQVEQQESDQDRNWKAFLEKRKEEQKILEAEREKNKRLEEEKARSQKTIEEMKEAFKALVEKKDDSPYESEEEEYKKKLRQEFEQLYEEKEKTRLARQKMEELERERMEIQKNMPDLMEVCSQENLAYLEFYHPEIAVPIGKLPDGFEKTKLAYQAVKKHVKMSTKEKEKIEKNLSKPRSVHSPHSDETQKESSSGYLEEKARNQVWEKMQRLISGQDED